MTPTRQQKIDQEQAAHELRRLLYMVMGMPIPGDLLKFSQEVLVTSSSTVVVKGDGVVRLVSALRQLPVAAVVEARQDTTP